jgi:hypothetical protein
MEVGQGPNVGCSAKGKKLLCIIEVTDDRTLEQAFENRLVSVSVS